MNEAIWIFELNKLITLQKNKVYACRNYPSKCSKKNPNPTATYFFPLLMHANELDIDLDEKKYNVVYHMEKNYFGHGKF